MPSSLYLMRQRLRRQPIDAETYQLATGILTQAKRRGQDPVEALHRAGLLVTPQGDRDLQAEALESALLFLHNHRVADFLRLHFGGSWTGKTNQDVYDSVISWFENYVKEFKKP